ncbi:MAG: insulinase family protein [Fimbriimonadaceae bacterium]|nr:insulinase family protein [Fimbriimonadaceae bacterium]
MAIAAPLLVALAMGHLSAPQVDQPRLRKDLGNGARLYTERRKGMDRFALCVAFEADDKTEGAVQGRRHLLEHMFARGDGTLDKTLEAKGCTLSASTTRDTMYIEVNGPTAALNDAVTVLRGLFMSPLKVTQEQIVREGAVLAEEAALRPWWASSTDAAWTEAFGAGGATLFPQAEDVAKVTPGECAELLSRTLVGSRTTMSLVADLDTDAMAKEAARAVGVLPKGEGAAVSRDSTQDVVTAGGDATVRAVVVPGLGFSSTMTAMAVAFALQDRVPGVQAVFTPSAHTCLVVVAFRTDDALARARQAAKDDRGTLAVVGRTAVRGWARGVSEDPLVGARTRALLMQTSGSASADLLLQQAAGVSDDAFLAMLDKVVGEATR